MSSLLISWIGSIGNPPVTNEIFEGLFISDIAELDSDPVGIYELRRGGKGSSSTLSELTVETRFNDYDGAGECVI